MKAKRAVAIVGAGLAGCEAAWQLARRDIPVTLFEMRPQTQTPAHRTDGPAELVCSNSFKSLDIANAHGLLKAEMELADSLIISAARTVSLPAGSALAVDREKFSDEIKSRLSALPSFQWINREITSLDDLKSDFETIIVAAGPLMADPLANDLKKRLADDGLYFYDAIAPVVYTHSIDLSIAFKASRYDKGDADYINCPMNRSEYHAFVEALITADKVPFNDYEQARHFEGCLPVEVLAERGPAALSFGAMKPVGLIDPRTGDQPFAVLQLRQENSEATLYNLVGCQTRMKWPQQKRVFRMIPGLQACEFARFGSMHRNTFINAPLHLNADLSLKQDPAVVLAGQITGVEGYTESAAMGLWAALNLLLKRAGETALEVDKTTMIGGLIAYLQTASPRNFQPMNANFGLLTPIKQKIKNKREKRQKQAEQALESWKQKLAGRVDTIDRLSSARW